MCSPYKTEIEDLCDNCKTTIGEETLNEWRAVKQIMANHDFPSAEVAAQMLPNVDPELLQATLNTELQFNSNYYRIHTPQEIEDAERSLAAASHVEERPKL